MIYNELKRHVPLLTAYAKLLGEDDAETGRIERLGETLTPILDVWSRDEMSALHGEALWWVRQTVAAVAATNSAIGVFVPAGANVICTVEGWIADASSAQVGSLLQATAVANDTRPVDARDRRYGSSQSIPIVHMFSGALAVPANTISWGSGVTVNTLIQGVRCVVTPGNNFVIVNPAVNAALNASIYGRVRRAFIGELGPVPSLG